MGIPITIYLLDGTSTGKIKCTIGNWAGIAYKIPRNLLGSCFENKTLNKFIQQTGIYFLLGENETGQFIYVGQAGPRRNVEGILGRLLEHRNDPEKNYWSEAIVFTHQNNSLGPTQISYLENKFYNMARDAGRYIVKNGNTPTPGNATEEITSEMDAFINYAKIIMGVLGHKVFEPVIQENEIPNTPTFNFKGNNIEATLTTSAEGFVLLKGSQICSQIQPSAPQNVKNARSQYKSKISDNYILLDNIPFSSPSFAASFVAGGSRSGNQCWKTSEGKSPKDLNI